MNTLNESHLDETSSIYKFGLFSSITLALITLFTFVIAFLTPPLSGPFCIAPECYQYPYTDIASRFPRDYYWMYPAMLLMVVYVMFVVSIHYSADSRKKIYTSLGVIFSAMSAFVLIMDYFIQVSVIQPSLLNKEFDGISLLSQYNPHGIFIVLEELAFILMSLSFLFFFVANSRKSKLEIAVRWIFFAGFILTVLALLLVTIQFGIMREYRLEVYVISINWLVLIVVGILQAIVFSKKLKSQAHR